MFRVLPQRWTIVPAFALFGLVVGGVWSAVNGGVQALIAEGDAAIVAASTLAGGVGITLGLVAVFVNVPGDSRHLALVRAYPNAIVVQGWKAADTVEALLELVPWHVDPQSVGSAFSVVFDEHAVSVYTGARTPAVFAYIPWADVSELQVGEFQQAGSYNARIAMQKLRIVASKGDIRVDLQFGVAKLVGFGANLHDEGELGDLVQSIAAMRRLPISQASTFGFATAELLPGIPAYSLAQFSRPAILATVGLIAMAPTLVLLVTGGRAVHFAIAFFVVVQGGIYALMFAASRANKREAAAGYTTLNRVHLDREQRHPRTGRVLRAAGAPPLTKEEFREALALNA